MNKTVSLHTLGCRVNMYESCAIAEQLIKEGFSVVKNVDSDYYVVNTCAVTAESERKSRQLVRKCASKGKVLVIGCASQIDLNYANIDNVIYAGGNQNKSAVIKCIMDDIKGVDHTVNAVIPMDNAIYEEMQIDGEMDLFSECRAFLKIEDGCNGKCTYCIIPKCRGKVRSRNPDSIVSEAIRLVNRGYREIILTGIEVGAYNIIPLYELVKRVSETEGLKRLRLGSLSPNIINERFLETVSKLENFMPHFHLSLQSCSDTVLAAMKRPYRKDDIYKRVALIRKYFPNSQISADIIVGFPNETQLDFEETLNSVKELELFHLHSFPYSERKGTLAAEMKESVPRSLRNERNLRLIAECDEVKNCILERKINNELEVLIEKIQNGFAYGHTREFFEAKLTDKGYCVGDIVTFKIISHENGTVIGQAI